MIQSELHILPTDVMPTCPSFTGKTGPTRLTTQEEAVVQHYNRIPFPRQSKWLLQGGQPNRLGHTVTVNGGIYRCGFPTASVNLLTEAVMLQQPPRLMYLNRGDFP